MCQQCRKALTVATSGKVSISSSQFAWLVKYKAHVKMDVPLLLAVDVGIIDGHTVAIYVS